MSQTKTELVLVHAPYGRDASMICQVLGRSGINSAICATVPDLCSELGDPTGAALISDEALTPANVPTLARALSVQPPWSDLPLLITTVGGEATRASRARLEMLEPLGNFSLLERPLRGATLISAVNTALRARRRQFQLRENFTERERLVKELERSNGELSQFAHVISHDLQAPIRSVNIFSELLARRFKDKLGGEADEFIAAIQDGASKMEAMIRTLLNYATFGQEPSKPERLALASVVDAVKMTLQPAIEELGAEVTYDDLPIVHGDRVLLEQLVQNLVGNALKYCEPGVMPRVHISAETWGNEWIITVRDNGPGIAPEQHHGIFLPLRRLHGKEIPGTGIGLAVCRKIAERHRGRIWVESERGKGAAFRFALSRLDANATQQRS